MSKKVGGEYGEIRANIHVERLNEYLREHVKIIHTPVQVKQFKFGQSNPTYFLTDASNTKFVLRKKPSGPLISKTAHQVEREYFILSAIHKYNSSIAHEQEKKVPIPTPIWLCEDSNILGTNWYIMEFLDGRIFTNTMLGELSCMEDRKQCWLSATRALANIGSITPSSIGLTTFGPSTPYFPRQIKSMSKVSHAQSLVKDIETGIPVGEIPFFQEMIGWYKDHLPDEGEERHIVHGDYKMDNLVFHPTENRVIGILDWELCTLGSPLADFANLLQPWSINFDTFRLPPSITPFGTLNAFKNNPNAPLSVDILEKEYAKHTNQAYPIKGFLFAQSWMLFRLAVISQGIAARHAQRQASSEVAWVYSQMFPIVGGLARQVLEDEKVVSFGAAKL